MKLSDNYNYAEAYLTLRCNFNCSYCINASNDGIHRERNEMNSTEWITYLNKIDFGDIPLTLGGGEPTKHKEFYKIINGIKPETKIDLLTNLSFNVDEFIEKVSPERFSRQEHIAHRSIRVSYHPTKSHAKFLAKQVKKLQDAGFPIGIFGISHPYTISDNMEMTEYARREGVFFYNRDFLGEVDGRLYGHYKYTEGLDGKLKEADCKTKEILISPGGSIHRCHRDLYKRENAIQHISKGIPEPEFRHCNKFGDCNLCDLKLKTNYFLGGVECQVEIKDL